MVSRDAWAHQIPGFQAFSRLCAVALCGPRVEELNQAKLTPLLKLKYHDSIPDAVADLGRPDRIGKVFIGIFIYKPRSL